LPYNQPDFELVDITFFSQSLKIFTTPTVGRREAQQLLIRSHAAQLSFELTPINTSGLNLNASTAMGFLERKLFDDYPHVIGVSLAGILSVFSLGPTPGMIPIIFTLSILLIYSRKIFPTQAPHKSRHTIVLWVALTIGSSIPRITPSIHALSQPVLSVLFLFILSGITSALSIGTLFIETRVSSRYSSKHHTIRLLLFPMWWTTIWTAIAYLSPLGMLSTWSPVEGISAYDWMLPIFGPQSLNWVVAAWAVVVSETLMSLYMGSEFQDEEESNLFIPTETRGNHRNMAVIPPGDHNTVHSTLSKRDKTAVLAALLVLLIVPSYSIDSLPVPLGDVSIATPLSVGCALPTVDEYKVPKFDFGHYLTETKRLDSTANFILWPESAVHFDSEADRNQHLDEIRKQIHHAFVGVSFDETLVDTENSKNRYGIKRNGIAIVSNRSDTPHLVYYKRHLVPSKPIFLSSSVFTEANYSRGVLLSYPFTCASDHVQS